MCVGCIELSSKVKAITHFVGYFLCYWFIVIGCGTNRSEGVVVMLIQKRKSAKRIYSTIRHIKCTSMKSEYAIFEYC